MRRREVILAAAGAVVARPRRAAAPAVYSSRIFVDAGGLLSYGNVYSDQWKRAADYADRILRGAKPSELPVEFPTKFQLIVNLTAARALGLTVPPILLAQADEVIQ